MSATTFKRFEKRQTKPWHNGKNLLADGAALECPHIRKLRRFLLVKGHNLNLYRFYGHSRPFTPRKSRFLPFQTAGICKDFEGFSESVQIAN